MVALSLNRKTAVGSKRRVRLPGSLNPSSVLPAAREVDTHLWPVATSPWIFGEAGGRLL